ncbi:uncharacterized protein LOC134850886 isoform X2 [Symsagittifera roscoffensis]|uniref:uncharacterized protein LOC134850886 isoform X2 n=1 Tax=Symsagittifera roscoffensis TaxID=84072 RepID=UPI00307C9315
MSKSIFTEFADLLIKENWSLDVLLRNEHLVKVQLIGSPEMKSPTVGTECMLHLLKMTEQIYLLTVHQNGRLLARETINVSAGTDKLRDWWDGYRATMLNCIHLAKLGSHQPIRVRTGIVHSTFSSFKHKKESNDWKMIACSRLEEPRVLLLFMESKNQSRNYKTHP